MHRPKLLRNSQPKPIYSEIKSETLPQLPNDYWRYSKELNAAKREPANLTTRTSPPTEQSGITVGSRFAKGAR
eukprot:6455524-Amphidinium_carterae.1